MAVQMVAKMVDQWVATTVELWVVNWVAMSVGGTVDLTAVLRVCSKAETKVDWMAGLTVQMLVDWLASQKVGH